ncbi:ABC transporter permease [Clostridium sp. SHJSY1]|uniref:ABC transporter permease subunit n=1 Tax=Clostridium sp. SHJSY1 TaxID=2942483 RepID=UPI0028757CB4|nr:ABC transporter permease subunit [Clostridium sp. SHJSY1]MDS0527544.1 ABC transporter permease [Clostridium sp. SHJSY1]
MNIFLREMKVHTKSLILWCISSFILITSGIAKFSAASDSIQSTNEILSKMPKSLQNIIGVGSLNLSKASGYYGVIFFYLALMAGIFAAIIGSTIISKEERDKTAEFIYAKPVSRNYIITAKIFSGFLNVVFFTLFTFICSIGVIQYFGNGENVNSDIFRLMIGLFLIQLIFLFLGTAISSIIKKPRNSTSISTGILLVMFILSIIIDINDKLDYLKYFTPFKYFQAKDLMYGGELEPNFLFLSFIIIFACSTITYAFYNKKDLNI